MADESTTSQERTEQPTPRRREQAREEGKVARSQEMSSAVALLAGAAMLAGSGGLALATFSTQVLHESARALSSGPFTTAGAVTALRGLALRLVIALLPFAAATMAIVVLAGVAQTRGAVSWKPLAPKFSNLSPATGIKRILSTEGVFTLLKSLAKLAVLALVTTTVMSKSWPELLSLADTGPSETAAVLRDLTLRLAFLAGFAFLVVAGVDYAFQWFKLEKSLRMSKQDVVREQRETEGDPMVKGRIRVLQRARARQRMFQQVPTADVVVVNPTHIAVALKYDTNVALAPVVVAMGERKIAERIKALALASGVPVIENRPVARALLATARVGKQIPSTLYAAIAEILAFVYRQRAGLPALPQRSES